jgi:hypothetical protein
VFLMQLPKIVAARLQRSSTSEHPDPDLIAAFAEQKLPGKERDSVLEHLSACAECRQLLVLAAPELISEAISGAFGNSSWLRMPMIRWGAVAACVVIVAAAMLVRKGEGPPRNGNSEAATQQSTTPGTSAAASSEEPRPFAATQLPAMKAGTHKVPLPSSKSLPQEVASAHTAQVPVANAPAARKALDSLRKSQTAQVEGEASDAEVAPEIPADQQLRTRNSVVAAQAAPVFTPRRTTETAASTIGGPAKFTDFRSPSWRLSADGLPERSFTSGQWEKVQVDHAKGFRALAALGMEVWVGGPSGMLYHSEDMGLNWTRLIPVTGSSTLSGDIIAIAFADHAHGKLTTAAGRTWVTSDAGRTWETQ